MWKMMLHSLVLTSVWSARPLLYTQDPLQQRKLWDSFKIRFSKQYATADQEAHRFRVFVNKLRIIDERNAQEEPKGGAQHGITQFADLTTTEFKTQYLTFQANNNATVVEEVVFPELRSSAVGVKADWTGIYTTPIKNQGHCGSCWAFSAVEQTESDAIRTLGIKTPLSTQQVISCDLVDHGCDGGDTSTAYDYIRFTSKGLVSALHYPDTSHRTGDNGECDIFKLGKPVVKVKGFKRITGLLSKEKAMASYVNSTGPLSICVDAQNWDSYVGGVMSTCGQKVDHCVQIVGIDTTGLGILHPPYWKVRNSWGPLWGEAGHIRLRYGVNECALSHEPTYVEVANATQKT